MSATARGEGGTRGFALIVVLWFLVLISTIGIYLLVNARAETAIAHNTRAAASAEALADAGIARAALNQLALKSSSRWKLDGSANRVSLPAGEIVVRVRDETAKINPNLASDALLAALFQAVGVDGERARHLGAAIADWVGPAGPPRPLGAKLEQYRAAGRSYGPPNGPLDSLDDLGLVLGMTPQILATARPYLTLYTQSGPPKAKFLPVVMQRALMIAARASSAAEATAPQAGAPQAANPAASSPQASADSGAAAAATAPSDTDERVIAVTATAHSRDGGIFLRQAVLRLDLENPRGYVVLEWQRGSLDESGLALND